MSRQLWWGHRIPVWTITIDRARYPNFPASRKGADSAADETSNDVQILFNVAGLVNDVVEGASESPDILRFFKRSTKADALFAKMADRLALRKAGTEYSQDHFDVVAKDTVRLNKTISNDPRHLVFLGTLAAQHARLAGCDGGPRQILSHQRPAHRPRHHHALGGANGDDGDVQHGDEAESCGNHSGSLSLVRGGEGWGEGRFARHLEKPKSLPARPLTPTLSPEYRGEGAGGTRKVARAARPCLRLLSKKITGEPPVPPRSASPSTTSRLIRPSSTAKGSG